ncbi:hypothetical protein STEG23_023295, partial [Scotinomys teguina]
MAAREELYSKVTPRRDRLQRPGTVKHGSALDVLLSMGFPRARAYFRETENPVNREGHPHQACIFQFLQIQNVPETGESTAPLLLTIVAASLSDRTCGEGTSELSDCAFLSSLEQKAAVWRQQVETVENQDEGEPRDT